MDILSVFLYNMTIIITFVYIAIKILNKILKSRFSWLAPIFFSLLPTFIMSQPFEHEGISFDLRSVPIFFVSYIGGVKTGLLVSILPAIFKLYIGGQTTLPVLLFGILSPVIIGSLFHHFKSDKRLSAIIDFKEIFLAFMTYQIFHVIAGILFINIPYNELIKIFLGSTLFSLISLLIIVLMMNDANKSYNLLQQLKYQSNHDYLSTLSNRQYFINQAERLLEADRPIVVALLDIDYFKHYNDTNGHLAGDEVIRSIAQILLDNIREGDLVARFGGEEFILCLSGVTLNQAGLIADRIRRKVEESKFKGEEKQPDGNLTVSIGLSGNSRNKSLLKIIDEADNALYKSKHSGRNQVSFYED